tara:strand:- start:758 stop:2557 length:1800 start_codon:yes stop_codon:yes gene_type:complete
MDNNNTDYKIVKMSSNDADKIEDISLNDYKSRLTFYFKNPIILNDIYDLNILNFNVKKLFVGEAIRYQENLNGIGTFTTDTTKNIIKPTLYNSIVENTTTIDVPILRWDGSAFQTSDGLAHIAVQKNSNDANGSIISVSHTTAGTGFVLNDYIYIDKNNITTEFNSYTNRYAEFKITSLTDEDVLLELSNYANRAIIPAIIGTPINERTYAGILLWRDDGSGWYEYADASVNCEVKLPYVGATFANIDITGIYYGGSGHSVDDFVYIDKETIINGEGSMTYNSGTRFAKYQVSGLVNGINTSVLSANIEILPNERENDIEGGRVYRNLPLLTSLYVDTGARATASVVASTIAGQNIASLNITSITNIGTGFSVADDFYIDKELVIPPNTYDAVDRYAKYTISALSVEQRNIELINNTNYGYNSSYQEGFWYYDIPGTNTRIHFEVFKPAGFSRQARLLKMSGDDSFVYNVDDVIDLVNADVVLEVSGIAGTAGTAGIGKQYGNLQVKVISTFSITTLGEIYKLAFENIKYNNQYYFNSNKMGHPHFLTTDLINKGIYNKTPKLTLEPQIISELKILLNRKVQANEVIDLTFLLKKNNII